MKVSNIKYKFKYQLSTIVICGSYMHEFGVSKDMKKYQQRYKEKGGGSGEGAFVSNTNYQRIEN